MSGVPPEVVRLLTIEETCSSHLCPPLHAITTTASVFTQNIDRAIRFAKALDAGNVAVNCTSPMAAPDMEFGGTKMSGIGREGGPRALEQWLETKSIYIQSS